MRSSNLSRENVTCKDARLGRRRLVASIATIAHALIAALVFLEGGVARKEILAIWQHRVDQDFAQVCGWPDFLKWAALNCPGEYFALSEASEGESRSSPDFGSIAVDWSAIESVLAWKRGIESRTAAVVESKDALRCARTLLYEYAMRCASTRSLEPIRVGWGSQGVALVNGLVGNARDTIAWLNLAQVLPGGFDPLMYGFMAHKPAIGFSAAWVVEVLLGDAIQKVLTQITGFAALACLGVLSAAYLNANAKARGRYRRSKRVDIGVLQRLRAKWPDGCPPLVENVEAFIEFVQDCAPEGLLDRRGRSELQAAVAKAWEQPTVNRGQMVFVSYSHQQADLARHVASGLSELGVAAILDRYELDRDASGAALETWIAESMMRSVATVYLVSENVRLSGWVHHESEWQMRLLGIKPSLVLPYIVSFGEGETSARYPRSRTIDGKALVKRPAQTIKRLAERVTLDWLVTLKSMKLDRDFGIAYQSERVVDIVAKPTSTTLGSAKP